MSAIETALPKVAGRLSPHGFLDVARAIMTTDTFPKAVSTEARVGHKTFTVAAVAKGAGMIRPHMATMLCFVCTDMGATPEALDNSLARAVAGSFNAITVDGDMSTNDTVLVLANGLSGLNLEEPTCAAAFQEVLDEVLGSLALQIVQDGEGATKLVRVEVEGAPSEEEARKIAYTVSESPLVKTALFGEDANWGRIMAAIGRAGVAIKPEAIQIRFGDIQVVRHGQGCGHSAEAAAKKVLETDRIAITIDLGLGTGTATVHTCDLSTDYVRINADYRT